MAAKKKKPPATLLDAARAGDLAATLALLDAGADPNAAGEYDILPLGEAVGARVINPAADAVAFLLLERGADPVKAGGFGEAPLDRAAYIGADALAREMVRLAGDRFALRLAGAAEPSLLHRACNGGLLWLAQRCVDEGADPLSIGAGGASCLHFATSVYSHSDASPADRLALVDWLLDRGNDPNLHRPGEWGGSALHNAAAHADAAVVARLLDRGADPGARSDVSQHLPIHRAAFNVPEVVALLCARGADPDATAAGGRRPLHVFGTRARYCDRPGVVDAFVDAGAGINALDDLGLTPLAVAIGEHGNTRSPLTEKQRAVFARFVARGADLRCAAPGGATLLILAGRLGDAALAQLAMAGSELGQYDGHGWSALHYAATQADGAIAGALLAAGADPKQPTRRGHKYARQTFAAGATPREIARAVGATAVVERLA